METKNLTIMFVDLAGYTLKTSSIPRDKFLELLETYERIVEPIFSRFNGDIIKKIGDAFMVTFESPTNAILCGIDIQDALFKHNRHEVNREECLRVKIAINAGEVHIRNKDIYGEAVNIASRLEKIADINDVTFTESVYLSMNKPEIPSIFMGERRLKGIPNKIRVYKVLGEYSKILLEQRRRKRKIRKTIKNILLLITALLILAVFFVLLNIYLSL
ncbi:adenylate/guanylate cyclase domain-containing protein [Candidatus Woesearchaeota archaeon]|nr:adenylate/guanylate cyclase domain-containing protein [Candidatus Woesearchaeota archaeon]